MARYTPPHLDPEKCRHAFFKLVEEPDEASILDRLLVRACAEYLAEGKTEAYQDYLFFKRLSEKGKTAKLLLAVGGLASLTLAAKTAGLVSFTAQGTLALIAGLALIFLGVVSIMLATIVDKLDRPIRELEELLPADTVAGWVGAHPVVLHHYRSRRRG